ncbi:MAG: hypothetical protein QXU40_00375 [Candidatus Pacearchaeota archaeon]
MGFDKGGEITGEEVVKIILAVIGISILLVLSFKLWSIQKRTEAEKASISLDIIYANLQDINENNPEEQFIIEAPSDWYLVSIEKPVEGLCKAAFCLCFCKDKYCEKTSQCKQVDKFVLLREGNGKETRALKQKSDISNVKINYKEGVVYPFTFSDFRLGKIKEVMAEGITLFLKYDPESNSWLWSPDLTNWMPLDIERSSDGLWKNWILLNENRDFINNFNRFIQSFLGENNSREDIESIGRNFLISENVKESRGVIVFQFIE